MVKIRDLSNKQIVEQLTKYFTFITALDQERQKRLDSGEIEQELYTKEELEARAIAEVSKVQHKDEESPIPAESTTIFHLKMDDNQLDEIAVGSRLEKAQAQVDVKDLLSGKSESSHGGAFREIESDVTSHKLHISPKKTKKRSTKK
ncbi:MAG: hypothetical protein HN576_01055 [Bacteriovoracaceae bacterium]|jgi:hypothetical protein|nr:hypothetical protein [Bacteriovoracaceae bacterium]